MVSVYDDMVRTLLFWVLYWGPQFRKLPHGVLYRGPFTLGIQKGGSLNQVPTFRENRLRSGICPRPQESHCSVRKPLSRVAFSVSFVNGPMRRNKVGHCLIWGFPYMGGPKIAPIGATTMGSLCFENSHIASNYCCLLTVGPLLGAASTGKAEKIIPVSQLIGSPTTPLYTCPPKVLA